MSAAVASPPTPTATSARGGARGRLGRADLGPLPVLAGLAGVWILFQLLNENFLSSRNLSNLVLQLGVTGVLALAVVLVLLIGEIDLSLGSVAGAGAALLGVLLTNEGWPVWAALAAAIGLGVAAGLLQGGVAVLVGVPAFIVTLGGLLAFQGVQLAVLGDVGELRVEDQFIRDIANAYVPSALAWLLLVGLVAGVGADVVGRRRERRRLRLAIPAATSDGGRVAGVAVLGALVVAYLDGYFGVPWLLVVLVALTLALTWATTRTVFGRHVYAVGGNAEAARRAGVPVDRVRLAVFATAAGLAALGGVVAVSRQFAVSAGTGGGNLLLEAIAAAVIGGTSLFGGRGRVYHALLGALVIASVQNGLDLLGEPTSTKNIATGVILVAAVSLDAVNRRRRAAAGT